MAASSLDVHSQLQGECLVFLCSALSFPVSDSHPYLAAGDTGMSHLLSTGSQEPLTSPSLRRPVSFTLDYTLSLVNCLAQVCYQIKRGFRARTQRIWDHPHSWKITLTLRWLSHERSREMGPDTTEQQKGRLCTSLPHTEKERSVRVPAPFRWGVWEGREVRN